MSGENSPWFPDSFLSLCVAFLLSICARTKNSFSGVLSHEDTNLIVRVPLLTLCNAYSVPKPYLASHHLGHLMYESGKECIHSVYSKATPFIWL